MDLAQSQSVFVLPVRVYYEDTDHGGVVYYANYLKFMERSRTEYLRSCGLEQDRLINHEDLIFAVSRAEIDYKRPATFNNLLLVTAEIAETSRVKMTFKQQIYRTEHKFAEMSGFFQNSETVLEHGTLLCDARISIAALGAVNMRPKRIPQTIFEELMREH